MERRTLLRAACACAAGLAGCPAVGTESDPSAPESPTSATPISAYDCPPYGSDRDGVVCSHTVDTESTSVYLLPSETSASTPETVDLTLYNESSTGLEFNPYGWSVAVATESGWTPMEKRASGDGRLTLRAGETHSWTFREAVDAVDDGATLDPGTYAAGIGVPDPDGPDWLRCLALVRLR